MSGSLRFASLVANNHTCGLTVGGEAWCWGNNNHGQLGSVGLSGAFSAVPVRAGGTLLFSTLATGYTHTCGIGRDGATYCWGNALGLGSARSEGPQATAVAGGLFFTSITAGDSHSCGVTAAGVAYCWGTGGEGELGNAATANMTSPVPVSGGHTFLGVSAGHFYSCGVDTGGKAWCWGLNNYGSLGIGGPASSVCGVDGICALSPVAVSRGLIFSSVNTGNWVTCGLTTAGPAYCWGRNNAGNVGTGRVDGADQFAPVGIAGVP